MMRTCKHRRRSTSSTVVLTFSGALLLACAREVPTTVAPTLPETAPASATAPPTATSASASENDASGFRSHPVVEATPGRCTDSLPQKDMIRDNIAATAMTGVAEIVASKALALDGKSPAPASGYITFRYEVHVVRWVSGGGADRLVLMQNAEAPTKPLAPGHLLFFSACAAPDGSGYEPDVGYFFPLEPSCRADAEALGDAAAKRARAGGKRAPSACARAKP